MADRYKTNSSENTAVYTTQTLSNIPSQSLFNTTKLFSIKYNRRLFLGIITILLSFKMVLWIIYPDTGMDGPIYLSHTFSVLQGRPFHNYFLEEYLPVFNFPYLYGFLNAPLYMPFTGTAFLGYSIFFWNIFFILLFLFLCSLVYKHDSKRNEKTALVAFAFLLNFYSYTLRSEVFILPFFVLLYLLCRNAFANAKPILLYLVIPLLIAIIGLIHPVAGLLACLLTFLFGTDKMVGFKRLFVLFLICAAFVAVLYLPVMFLNIDAWKWEFWHKGFESRKHSLTDLSPFFKYISYNPVMVVVMALIFLNTNHLIREIVYWLASFMVTCYFHQSYYYHYLFIFLIWRLKETDIRSVPSWFKPAYFLTAGFGFFIVFVLPSVQVAENPGFVAAYRTIEQDIRDSVYSNGNKKIWIPANYAMPVLDRSNIRVHWQELLNHKRTMRKVDTNSIFYVTQQSQMNYIRALPMEANEHLSLTQIVSPVKGLITVSPSLERSEPIGLWKVDVIHD